MFRYLLTIFILFLSVGLFAEPEFYPMTQVGEAFLNTSNAACNDAAAGLTVVEDQFSNSEFFSLKYYSQSAGLSNPFSEARVNYYDISTFPTVIFNGTEDIIGGGPAVINGSDYAQYISQNRFAPSPIMMQLGDYNSFYGTFSVNVKMMSPTYSIQNQSIHFVLVQTGLPTEPTNVVREVITQPITLSGLNNNVNIGVDFATEYYGVVPEYWAAAFVQLDNGQILQAVSILPQPSVGIRAVVPFSTAIIDSAGINFNSEAIWFYNRGQSTTYTMRLLKDSGPDDWYFNYCSEDGNCYPGFAPHNFILAGGASEGYHLNLIIGSSGTATFHFIIEAPDMEPYIIPFTYQTSDTPNQDYVLPVADLTLLQNYPNPFTRNTVIKLYSKLASQPALIEVFNTKGQKVSTLSTGVLKAGTNELSWNGSGSDGRRLAQGIYYYRLQGSTASQAQKLLILDHK